jgi:selenoprotein W-related protein
MDVELKYCAMWNYEPQALSLTGKLLTAFKQQIRSLTLIPMGGGCFELSLNGELVYSKLKTHKFPDEKWVLETVGTLLRKKKWSLAASFCERVEHALAKARG